MSVHPNKRIAHEQAMELREKRMKANQEILNKLSDYLKNNLDQRFFQALVNLEIVIKRGKYGEEILYLNDYNTESEDILKRMK